MICSIVKIFLKWFKRLILYPFLALSLIVVIALVITAASLMYSINSIRQTQKKVQVLEKQLSDYKHEVQQKDEYIKKSLPQVPDSLKKK